MPDCVWAPCAQCGEIRNVRITPSTPDHDSFHGEGRSLQQCKGGLQDEIVAASVRAIPRHPSPLTPSTVCFPLQFCCCTERRAGEPLHGMLMRTANLGASPIYSAHRSVGSTRAWLVACWEDSRRPACKSACSTVRQLPKQCFTRDRSNRYTDRRYGVLKR